MATVALLIAQAMPSLTTLVLSYDRRSPRTGLVNPARRTASPVMRYDPSLTSPGPVVRHASLTSLSLPRAAHLTTLNKVFTCLQAPSLRLLHLSCQPGGGSSRERLPVFLQHSPLLRTLSIPYLHLPRCPANALPCVSIQKLGDGYLSADIAPDDLMVLLAACPNVEDFSYRTDVVYRTRDNEMRAVTLFALAALLRRPSHVWT